MWNLSPPRNRSTLHWTFPSYRGGGEKEGKKYIRISQWKGYIPFGDPGPFCSIRGKRNGEEGGTFFDIVIWGKFHGGSKELRWRFSLSEPYSSFNQRIYILREQEGTPCRHTLRRLSPVCITVLWVLGSYTDRQVVQYTADRAVI